jgi:hypothetical protein
MENSWNRGLYDYNTSIINNGQSTMISERIFDQSVNNNIPSSTQAESELFKLNYILSRDVQSNYVPQCKNTSPFGCVKTGGCTLFDQINVNMSTKSLEPVSLLREKKMYRFEPLIYNPQNESQWMFNRIGSDTKLEAINNYKPNY